MLERLDSRGLDRCGTANTHSDWLLTKVPDFRVLSEDPGFRFEPTPDGDLFRSADKPAGMLRFGPVDGRKTREIPIISFSSRAWTVWFRCARPSPVDDEASNSGSAFALNHRSYDRFRYIMRDSAKF